MYDTGKSFATAAQKTLQQPLCNVVEKIMMKEHCTLYSFNGQIDTLDQLQDIFKSKLLYFKRPLPMCGVSTHSPAVLLAVGDVDHAGDVLAQELVTDLPQHLQLALVSTH